LFSGSLERRMEIHYHVVHLKAEPPGSSKTGRRP